MNTIPCDMHYGSRFSLRASGDFIVVNYDGAHRVKIRFIDTGYEMTTQTTKIRQGSVKDRLLPCVYGVGCIGCGSYSWSSSPKAYKAWSRMMERCYSAKFHKKSKTYTDCEVCEEWQDFQGFARWYDDAHPNDGKDYELDKDIAVKGNKLYSPLTCVFVSSVDNRIEAGSRDWILVAPNGETVNIYNLLKYCDDNGLKYERMAALGRGEVKSHKGWTKP